MFVDIISVEETLGYLNYVDQFTSVYESDDVEVDVSQLLDSIQD
jgi:hypothetical protein|tara:strand:+ start:698 stop:829 length:132 start_codon:yes stop_codon:yes gene_type:complete